MTLTAANALFGHTSEDTAYLVDDYPYGYKLRTEIRYWIETTKHGDRFCSQTRNPRTGLWNKPKKSTYSALDVMYLDEQQHVTYAALSNSWPSEEAITTFVAITDGKLSDEQKRNLAAVIGRCKAYAGVKFTINDGKLTADQEAAQATAERRLAHAVAVESHTAREMLG